MEQSQILELLRTENSGLGETTLTGIAEDFTGILTVENQETLMPKVKNVLKRFQSEADRRVSQLVNDNKTLKTEYEKLKSQGQNTEPIKSTKKTEFESLTEEINALKGIVTGFVGETQKEKLQNKLFNHESLKFIDQEVRKKMLERVQITNENQLDVMQQIISDFNMIANAGMKKKVEDGAIKLLTPNGSNANKNSQMDEYLASIRKK